jgi:cytochrome c oxidase subunit II
MTGILLTLLVVLIFVVLYQIGKSSELSAILKDEERTNSTRNKWMAWSMLMIFPVFMIGIYYCHQYFQGKMLPASASDHGVKYDSMFMWTLVVTGIVFVLTQFLLFYFSFKYQASEKRTAFFFAHSNKLELIWTIIPAIAMTVLVVIGLKNWFNMTSEAPANAQIVEVIGKQFNWVMRYPGADGVLGRKDYKTTNDANNVLGLVWEDPKTHDDIIVEKGELHIEKGRPVKLVIGSRDVIHDVGLSHFRMKMDAVPGVATSIWFTPLYTTEEMQKMTNNPKFVYEISCDQMCGAGHYSMRGTVIVHDKAGMAKWLSEQKSYYAQSSGMVAPAADPAMADSTKSITMNTIK